MPDFDVIAMNHTLRLAAKGFSTAIGRVNNFCGKLLGNGGESGHQLGGSIFRGSVVIDCRRDCLGASFLTTKLFGVRP
jgi:hypothetical protein